MNPKIARPPLKPVLGLLGIVALTTGLVWYSTRPTPPAEVPPTGLRADRLDPERQVLWVRVDTLGRLLDALRAEQPGVFDYRLTPTRLELRCAVGMEKAFNRLFLDDEYLSRLDNLAEPPLAKLSGVYGLGLPVAAQRGVPCVRLPAEVLQSLMIHKSTPQAF